MVPGGKGVQQKSPQLGLGKWAQHSQARHTTGCINGNTSASEQKEKEWQSHSAIRYCPKFPAAILVFLKYFLYLGSCQTMGNTKLVKNEMPLRAYCISTSALWLWDIISFPLFKSDHLCMAWLTCLVWGLKGRSAATKPSRQGKGATQRGSPLSSWLWHPSAVYCFCFLPLLKLHWASSRQILATTRQSHHHFCMWPI